MKKNNLDCSLTGVLCVFAHASDIKPDLFTPKYCLWAKWMLDAPKEMSNELSGLFSEGIPLEVLVGFIDEEYKRFN